jgi:GT2 family glycosyltransferase
MRHKTDYPAIEILIADNESAKPATRRYFDALSKDKRVRLVPCPGQFNFSAINNRAVRESRGSVLAFVNNDIEVIGADWLARMVAEACRPDVGAVGAKLLYPSGSVQHAGVVLGVHGSAGHAHRFFSADHAGYMRRLASEQYVSAVTAACLVVERAKFDQAGGFDESAFPVAFNDADLCLRLGACGLRTLYLPDVALLHKESATRARDTSPARREAYKNEADEFRLRWGRLIESDPCYNPNLTRTSEDFGLE